MKKQLNNQEVFNKVARALMKQGEASVPSIHDDITDTCRYRIRRGTKTLKCAVGHLIPAKLYDKKMEGVSAGVVIFGGEHGERRFEDISGECGLQDVPKGLLADLQWAHDDYLADDGIDAWRVRMLRIAGDYGLNTDVLEEPA